MYSNSPAGKRQTLRWLALAAVPCGALGLLAACADDKPRFSSIDLTGADYARDFSLTDHNGQARSIKDFAGKVVVLFFGFTQCPDACPTALAELVEIKKMLGPQGDRLQVFEFEGGHQWAPKAVVEKALDYVDSKLPK